jgi:regulatory protein
MVYSKRLNPEQAYQKIKQYCAYQERSHDEVKEKLLGYGLRKSETEELVALLIEENFLNEERFATGFARGKFRLKQWGRIKIRYELKQKKISNHNILKAMEEIDEHAYLAALSRLAKKKWESCGSGAAIREKKTRTAAWLMQRGYEAALITAELKKETYR